MPTFDTFEDVQAYVQAQPGYLPSFDIVAGGQTDEVFGGKVYKLRTYRWLQQMAPGTVKERRAWVHQVVENGAETWELNLGHTFETVEGITKTVTVRAGPQTFSYAMDSLAFELPTDADVANNTLPRNCHYMERTTDDPNSYGEPHPVVASYHRYKITKLMHLGAVAAEWEYLPRFTAIEVDTGFYGAADANGNPIEAAWYRLGGFTLPGGAAITLAGSNPCPITFPPSSAWTTATLYPQIPINDQLVDLWIRMRVVRSRPCYLDGNNVELRPYVDIDFDATHDN